MITDFQQTTGYITNFTSKGWGANMSGGCVSANSTIWRTKAAHAAVLLMSLGVRGKRERSLSECKSGDKQPPAGGNSFAGGFLLSELVFVFVTFLQKVSQCLTRDCHKAKSRGEDCPLGQSQSKPMPYVRARLRMRVLCIIIHTVKYNTVYI